MPRFVFTFLVGAALTLVGCDAAAPSVSVTDPGAHTRSQSGPQDPSLGAFLPQTYKHYFGREGLDLLFTIESVNDRLPAPMRAETITNEPGRENVVLYEEWDPAARGFMVYGRWPASSGDATICAYTSAPHAPVQTGECTEGVASTGAAVALGLAVEEDAHTSNSGPNDGPGDPDDPPPPPPRSYHVLPDGRIAIDHQGDGDNTVNFHLANSAGVIFGSGGTPLHTVTEAVYVTVLLPVEDLSPARENELRLSFPASAIIEFSQPTTSQD